MNNEVDRVDRGKLTRSKNARCMLIPPLLLVASYLLIVLKALSEDALSLIFGLAIPVVIIYGCVELYRRPTHVIFKLLVATAVAIGALGFATILYLFEVGD